MSYDNSVINQLQQSQQQQQSVQEEDLNDVVSKHIRLVSNPRLISSPGHSQNYD